MYTKEKDTYCKHTLSYISNWLHVEYFKFYSRSEKKWPMFPANALPLPLPILLIREIHLLRLMNLHYNLGTTVHSSVHFFWCCKCIV